MHYIEDHDIVEIQNWLAKRGLKNTPNWVFSSSGCIVPGVAAGFIYYTNSGMAFLDGYITNPEARMRDRYLALKAVTAKLLHIAEHASEVKMICCSSNKRSIGKMAMSFGFKDDGMHNSFSKILNISPLKRD